MATFAVLVFATAAGLVGVQMWTVYRAQLESVERFQATQARFAGEALRAFLETTARQVDEVARMPWRSASLDASDLRSECARLLKVNASIVEIWARDGSGVAALCAGRITLATAPAPEWISGATIPVDASAWRVGPLFEEDGAGHALPIVAERDPSGGATLFALIDMRFLDEITRRLGEQNHGAAFVTTADGRIVGSAIQRLAMRASLRDRSPEAATHMQRAGPVANAPLAWSSGRDGRVLTSAHRVQPFDWFLVLEQPADVVLAPVWQTLLGSATVFAIALVFASTFAVILSRRLANPILALRAGVARIASGEFGTRVDVGTRDEVRELATDVNHMAAQLEEYTGGLERKVAEKTALLEGANRHKSEFLANMSHELRTPLNAVIGFSEVLQEEMFGKLNPKQLEYVRDINASGHHLLSLINDILDLSKIEAGRMELDARPFDVAAALGNCGTLIRERAHSRGLRLSFDVAPHLGAWRGDERKFKQVVINLLSNAVKFTPSGGEVRMRASLEGDALVVSIADTGPGIALADQARAFEEFSQVKAAGDAKHEGTGLGLALARRLVELHGGSIDLESEPGKGARFTVRLPRLDPGDGA